MGTATYHDESGRPYTVRDGAPMWLPEPVYLDGERNPYTERLGSWAWLEPGRQGFLLSPLTHAGTQGSDGVLGVSYDRSVDDNLQMLEYHYRRGPARRALGSYGLLVSVGTAVWILMSLLAALEGATVISAFFAGGALLLALFSLNVVMLPRTRPRRLLRDYTADPYHRSSALGTRTVTLSSSGIAADGPLSQRILGWPLVSDVVVEEDGLYVYMGDELAVAVPARAFESRERFDQFAALASRYADQFKLTAVHSCQTD